MMILEPQERGLFGEITLFLFLYLIKSNQAACKQRRGGVPNRFHVSFCLKLTLPNSPGRGQAEVRICVPCCGVPRPRGHLP